MVSIYNFLKRSVLGAKGRVQGFRVQGPRFLVHRVFGTFVAKVACLGEVIEAATCDPKPYKIVGYDPLIRGSNP